MMRSVPLLFALLILSTCLGEPAGTRNMSWDIVVQDIPASARTVEEIPDDFEPESLGARSEIITAIQSVLPNADFSDPSWGVARGDGYEIEFNLGDEAEVDGFMMHVSGEQALEVVRTILARLGRRAFDMNEGTIVGPPAEGEPS